MVHGQPSQGSNRGIHPRQEVFRGCRLAVFKPIDAGMPVEKGRFVLGEKVQRRMRFEKPGEERRAAVKGCGPGLRERFGIWHARQDARRSVKEG